MTTTTTTITVHDYKTGEELREATRDDMERASKVYDSDNGVFVDGTGRSVYLDGVRYLESPTGGDCYDPDELQAAMAAL